jgi:predicted amidohydrolase
MASNTRIAIVQMKSSENKQDNLKESIGFVREASARKASIIFFPEFQMAFSPAGQTAKQLWDLAETLNGNFASSLCRAAKDGSIGIIATLYEKSDIQDRVFDTAIVIDPKGKISLVYRKLHLYDALGFKESDKLAPGHAIAEPARTKAGNIGLMICYDIRFPEMSRILAVKGATIFAAPSAWVHGVMKEEHWQTMLKARAIENGSYVVAPDQVGNIYSGRSMVVDPFGTVVLDMGNREGVETIEIDMARVEQVRESLPLLKNRRTDIYQIDSTALSATKNRSDKR